VVEDSSEIYHIFIYRKDIPVTELIFDYFDFVLILLGHEMIIDFSRRNFEESNLRKHYGYLNKYHN